MGGNLKAIVQNGPYEAFDVLLRLIRPTWVNHHVTEIDFGDTEHQSILIKASDGVDTSTALISKEWVMENEAKISGVVNAHST